MSCAYEAHVSQSAVGRAGKRPQFYRRGIVAAFIWPKHESRCGRGERGRNRGTEFQAVLPRDTRGPPLSRFDPRLLRQSLAQCRRGDPGGGSNVAGEVGLIGVAELDGERGEVRRFAAFDSHRDLL